MMVANLIRLILAAALVLTTLGGLESNARAAQPAANTWTEPGGAFSLHWDEPWVVQRQEPELLLVANGSTAAVASLSFPTADLNPSLCLDAYVDATASPEVKSQPPVMEGKTSWRAYAAYDNLQAGAVDYFECQVTPDGAAFAIFAGGTTLLEKYGNIPMLIDFLGQWVVRPDGEQVPVVAADGWRLAVVDWVRGSVYADLGLPPAPAGSDYLIVVADLSNWASAGTELSLGSIGALATDSSGPTAVDFEASRLAAETLGETPVEDVIVVEPGATRRVVLAFTVPTTAPEIGIALGGSAMALIDDGIPARLVVLPSPVGAPAMQTGVVSDVIDGRTLLVTLDDTGQSERVRLIGVDAPLDDAVAQLAGSVGQRVMLESDPAHPDDNRLQRYVWIIGDAGLPVLLNESLIEQGLASYDMSGVAGRFDVMLATGNGASPTEAAQEEFITPVTPQPDLLSTSELTEADLSYLAELARYRDNLRRSLQYYDMFLAAPTLDAEYFGHLGVALLSWTVFYDGIVRLQPTPPFADLHARLVSAFEPLDLLAYQIEPELDAILAGQTPQQPFAGFDYDVMTSTVSAARPDLEQVLAEVDAALEVAGIQTEGLVSQ